MTANKKKIFREWGRIVGGLIVFGFGVHLTIFANIGLAPWDCFGMGIARHTVLNFGLSMTVMGVVILFIDLAMKERIGFGTIIDALLTGNIVQFFNSFNPLPQNHSLPLGLLLMTIGFAFMAVGMYIYMGAAECCGPRDALLVGLGKRLPRLSIGVVEIILWDPLRRTRRRRGDEYRLPPDPVRAPCHQTPGCDRGRPGTEVLIQ